MTDNIILTIGSDIEEVDPFAYSENRDIKEVYVPENVKKLVPMHFITAEACTGSHWKMLPLI